MIGFDYLNNVINLIKERFKNFDEDLINSWQTEKVKKKILSTAPVLCKGNYAVEIMSVTSHEDFWRLILGIKSFFQFSRLTCIVSIVDDGTLFEEDKKILRDHLKKSKIITHERIEEDLKTLKEKIFFKYKNSPYLLKKICGYLYSSKNKIIFLDSDVIFFKYPEELVSWIKSSLDCFFIKDYQNAYLLSNLESIALFGVKQYPRVNSGVLGIKKKLIDYAVLVKLIKFYDKNGFFRGPMFQSYFAVIFSLFKNKIHIVELTEKYLVPKEGKELDYDKVVCVHYVNPLRSEYNKGAQVVLRRLKTRCLSK